MDYYPLFVKLTDRPCLVVGGGNVAMRKVTLLRKAGARVTVVAPELCPELEQLRDAGEIEHLERRFDDGDIARRVLVVASTDDEAVNRHISELATASFVPVNVVDRPELCTFITPSMIDRSPLQVAISTGGASPVLARLLRSRIESFLPASYGRLAAMLDSFRDRAKARLPNPEIRRRFWERLLEGPVTELVLSGRDDAAHKIVDEALEEGLDRRDGGGEVFLVGAGPGDPDLLTFRALRLMQLADVVVYDNLVSPGILELVRRDAEMIYAGKRRNDHALPQEDINRLLVKLAKEGNRVLRLKGGDPFIFGRGGEEIDSLMQEGIPFQVVPGVTAAAGCASFAGIPLTHRDYAQSLIFATGHLKNGTIDLNWNMLAQPAQTVVFYMGLLGLPIICRELKAHGRAASTPAALVEQGTTQNQRVLVGTLDTLPELVKEHDVKPPTLIIVGEVVALHERLKWFRPGSDHTAHSLFSSHGHAAPAAAAASVEEQQPA
ncbi:siroheme synthase CysG [Thioalkalivibrio sp.]|uniref:siroheme synthase CysG n=1 Tax=Thioalkalivibrio sp. TaxID=2093813 RepID=UPI0012D59780|nr:siroheme synthase CysG [Thioalkalivibrio sp.]TVP79981.1 MAG: uroporphyrinogen-III C-methyltransferase [Thioalkalivibrio sp.]